LKVQYSILLLLSLLVGAAQAQPIILIKPGQSLVVAGKLETFADSTRHLTLAQIRALYDQHRFSQLPGNRLLKNYTTANHWLHLRFGPANRGLVYLEIDNPRLNQVHFYQVTGGQLVNQVLTGDSLPFRSRGYPDYNWVFPVMPDVHLPTDVFVIVSKYGEVLNTQVRAWGPTAFEQHDRQRYLLWGILAGLTALVLLVNGMVWIATADGLYGWFMAVIIAHAFHLSAASGLSFQFLWPNYPIINDWYPQTISAWLIVLAQVHFMQRFIGQTAYNSRVFRYVNAFKYSIVGATALTIGLLLFQAVPLYYFRLLVFLTLLFSLLVVPLAILSLRERVRRREPIILFYAAITSLQFLSLMVYFGGISLAQLGKPLFEFTNEELVVVNFLVDLIILSLGVLYFGFTNYRQQNEQLLTTLHQQEQAQSGRIIEALEMERNRIAEDLYDDVGAMLSTAIGYVSSVARKPDVREKFPLLTEARHLLDRAVENLRTVSHNLMPKNFAELGLAKSLAETVAKVSASTDIQFEYLVVGSEQRLNTSIEVQIFRIAVELINDIIKNSGATQATFQLIFGAEQLQLISEDNGPYPPQYNNLHSKVAFINGKIGADVSPGGVTVVVEIPYR
jgi:signal transduction histidine kinase